MKQTASDILTQYYSAWTSGNTNTVLNFFADDAVFEDLGFEAKFKGKEQIKAFAELTYAGVPDFAVEPITIIGDNHRAAASWVMSGTHKGDLPGLPATGKRFKVRATSIIEFHNQLILKIEDYWNPIAFKRSVGLI